MTDFETPILFVIFNRIETTKVVFQTIKDAKPRYLYISGDGPRTDKVGEIEKCTDVRNYVLNNIDWECEVKTNFSAVNLGCGYGPKSAISWFFDNVTEGIILEDDTVPHSDFFGFASILLQKYRFDSKVLAINSSNFQDTKWGDSSYYFSMQNGPFCAWATWKRTWELFEFKMDNFESKNLKKYMNKYKATKNEFLWWNDILIGLKNNRFNNSSWDYQLIFAIWKYNGISIVPNVNLSSNIGFGPDATHTIKEDDITANRKTYSILPLIHAETIEICRKADLFYHNLYYQPSMPKPVSLIKQLKRYIKKQIKDIVK